MSHHRLSYEDVLHEAGHRVTPQRLHILDAVCDANAHTTLGEIYARVRRVDPSIDRSTLYRTLKLFVSLGLVVSADTGDGETYYEIAKPHPHHHLVCRVCGKQQEIDDTLLEPLFAQLLEQYGFAAHSDHLCLRVCVGRVVVMHCESPYTRSLLLFSLNIQLYTSVAFTRPSSLGTSYALRHRNRL